MQILRYNINQVRIADDNREANWHDRLLPNWLSLP